MKIGFNASDSYNQRFSRHMPGPKAIQAGIRRLEKSNRRSKALIESGALTDRQAEFYRAYIRANKSLINQRRGMRLFNN